jgi:hypothetical protein
LGPFPTTESGNKYVLAFMDHYSKWPILVAVPDTSAATVAKVLYEKVICEHGAPEFLLYDRGTAYMAELAKEVSKLLNIHRLNTSSYHPQTDVCQERFNSVIASGLSNYVEKRMMIGIDFCQEMHSHTGQQCQT